MPNLHTLTQYLLPKQALTRLAGAGARLEGGALTQWVYQWTLRSVPHPTPLNAQNPAAAALHELQVSVRWGQDAPRELTLSTLRPQHLLQPGERLR